MPHIAIIHIIRRERPKQKQKQKTEKEEEGVKKTGG